MGVTRWSGSSWNSADMPARAGDWYGSKMPASSARERNVLSTPYITSASGASLARIALLTIAPASPDMRMSTVTPLACSKAALTSSETAKESWVMTVNWVTAGLGEPVGGCPADADGDGLDV